MQRLTELLTNTGLVLFIHSKILDGEVKITKASICLDDQAEVIFSYANLSEYDFITEAITDVRQWMANKAKKDWKNAQREKLEKIKKLTDDMIIQGVLIKDGNNDLMVGNPFLCIIKYKGFPYAVTRMTYISDRFEFRGAGFYHHVNLDKHPVDNITDVWFIEKTGPVHIHKPI